MNWEWVIIYRKLLERRAIGMSIQLEPIVCNVFLEIIRVLVFCQKEIIVKITRGNVQKIRGDIIQYLILLLKRLELLIKFQKL